MSTYDTSSVNSGDAGGVGTTLTIAHTVASQSNRVLLVFVAIDGSETVTGITYNSVAMTKITPPGTISTGALEGLECWRLVAPSTGANNIVVTLSGDFTGSRITAVGVSAYGVDQTSPIAAQASSTSSNLTNPYATSITTTAVNQLVVDLLARSTGSASVGAGQTLTQEQLSGSPLVIGSYKTAASAGSNSMSYTTNDVSAAVLHIVIALANFNHTTSPTETVDMTEAVTTLRARIFTTLETMTLTDSLVATVATKIWRAVSKTSVAFVNTAKNNSTFQNVSKAVSSWVNTSKN